MDDEKSPMQEYRAAIQAARLEGMQQGKVIATARALHGMLKNMDLTPQEAMVLLEIPRRERKTYLKILANEERRRAEKKSRKTSGCAE